MSYSNFFKSFLKYFIQLTALFFLNWCLHAFMPVIVDALMKGMSTWNAVSVLYCWYIQIAFLVVSFSLREQLTQKAIHWLLHIPFAFQRILFAFATLCMLGVFVHALQLFLGALDNLTFLGVGELLLLIIQFGCLLGIAVPMVHRDFLIRLFYADKCSYLSPRRRKRVGS